MEAQQQPTKRKTLKKKQKSALSQQDDEGPAQNGDDKEFKKDITLAEKQKKGRNNNSFTPKVKGQRDSTTFKLQQQQLKQKGADQQLQQQAAKKEGPVSSTKQSNPMRQSKAIEVDELAPKAQDEKDDLKKSLKVKKSKSPAAAIDLPSQIKADKHSISSQSLNPSKDSGDLLQPNAAIDSEEPSQQDEISTGQNKNFGSPHSQTEFNVDSTQKKQEGQIEATNDDIQDSEGEQASELFETDSSNDNEDNNNSSLSFMDENLSSAGSDQEGRDIVAGSPTKLGKRAEEQDQDDFDLEKEKLAEEEEKKREEEKGRYEMNGIIVYDSYAKLKGCKKIVEYFDNKAPQKVDPYKLFSKEECKTVSKDSCPIFSEKARERDFPSDNDRYLYKNLPRFQTQRDFSNPQFEIFVPQQQNVLVFDSRFENGNLRKAAKVNNIEYNLWLENDLNTKGHTQWYYFKVIYKDIALRADKKTHRIKFNILNLAKTTSLYQVGMKPCIWSKRKYEEEGVGWFKGGEEISYTQNDITREVDHHMDGGKKMYANENNNNAFLYNNNGAGEGVDTYFTLSFKYEFMPNQDDEVYFAHAVPSTFSDMQDKLHNLKESGLHDSYMKMNILCYSLARTPIPLITVTENVDTYLDYYEEMRLLNQLPGIVKKQYRQKYTSAQKLTKQGEQSKGRVQRLLQAAMEEELKQFFEFNEDHLLSASPHFAGFGSRLPAYVRDHSSKKAIIITSRVHPGEPQASHMLNGLLDFVLSPAAIELRKHFVIRIVPMLNPDGVIYGNYRCSLLGCDLNRKWEKPNRLLHPPIYYSKQLIRHMHQERKVVLYCDLHGHSRRKNAFFFGCCFKNYEQEGRVRNAQLRLIPLMCCQKNDLFKFKDCRFRIEKCKESTARVVVFKEFNISNSFTLECSFFGKEEEPASRGIFDKEKTGFKSDPFSAYMPTRKKRITHMSVTDYNSLGETLMDVMHNYLPTEQYKLQFLSGKILDVFYDEFIKFVPPYILKREEEKRKKLEESTHTVTTQGQSQGKQASNTQVIPSQKGNGGPMRIASSDFLSVSNMGQAQGKLGRKQTMNYASGNQQNLNAIRQVIGGPVGTVGMSELMVGQKGDKKADLEDSSDQKAAMAHLSGNDTDQGFVAKPQMTNKESKRKDLLEFEKFMNGIQNKMKSKEEARKAKIMKDQDDGEGGQRGIYISDDDSDSDPLGNSSGDDYDSGIQVYTKPKKKTKKQKKKGNLLSKMNTFNLNAEGKRAKSKAAEKSGQSKKESEQGLKEGLLMGQTVMGNQALNQKSKARKFSRKIRSPRQLDQVTPVLQKKQQPNASLGIVGESYNSGFNGALQGQAIFYPYDGQGGQANGQGTSGTDQVTITQEGSAVYPQSHPVPSFAMSEASQVMNSQQIQNLIQNQLNSGVLNQQEILNEISKAIVYNQNIAQQALALQQNISHSNGQSSRGPQASQQPQHQPNEQQFMTPSKQRGGATNTSPAYPNQTFYPYQDSGSKGQQLKNPPSEGREDQQAKSTGVPKLVGIQGSSPSVILTQSSAGYEAAMSQAKQTQFLGQPQPRIGGEDIHTKGIGRHVQNHKRISLKVDHPSTSTSQGVQIFHNSAIAKASALMEFGEQSNGGRLADINMKQSTQFASANPFKAGNVHQFQSSTDNTTEPMLAPDPKHKRAITQGHIEKSAVVVSDQEDDHFPQIGYPHHGFNSNHKRLYHNTNDATSSEMEKVKQLAANQRKNLIRSPEQVLKKSQNIEGFQFFSQRQKITGLVQNARCSAPVVNSDIMLPQNLRDGEASGHRFRIDINLQKGDSSILEEAKKEDPSRLNVYDSTSNMSQPRPSGVQKASNRKNSNRARLWTPIMDNDEEERQANFQNLQATQGTIDQEAARDSISRDRIKDIMNLTKPEQQPNGSTLNNQSRSHKISREAKNWRTGSTSIRQRDGQALNMSVFDQQTIQNSQNKLDQNLSTFSEVPQGRDELKMPMGKNEIVQNPMHSLQADPKMKSYTDNQIFQSNHGVNQSQTFMRKEGRSQNLKKNLKQFQMQPGAHASPSNDYAYNVQQDFPQQRKSNLNKRNSGHIDTLSTKGNPKNKSCVESISERIAQNQQLQTQILRNNSKMNQQQQQAQTKPPQPPKTSNSPSILTSKPQNVMKDLKDQIAKDSASLDLILKQKQLQMQLEKQQQLLQQLQQQLQHQQMQQRNLNSQIGLSNPPMQQPIMAQSLQQQDSSSFTENLSNTLGAQTVASNFKSTSTQQKVTSSLGNSGKILQIPKNKISMNIQANAETNYNSNGRPSAAPGSQQQPTNNFNQFNNPRQAREYNSSNQEWQIPLVANQQPASSQNDDSGNWGSSVNKTFYIEQSQNLFQQNNEGVNGERTSIQKRSINQNRRLRPNDQGSNPQGQQPPPTKGSRGGGSFSPQHSGNQQFDNRNEQYGNTFGNLIYHNQPIGFNQGMLQEYGVNINIIQMQK